MSKFDYEVVKYEVTFLTGSTVRGRKNFDTIEDAIEYAKGIKEKEPIIYEKRKVLVDL